MFFWAFPRLVSSEKEETRQGQGFPLYLLLHFVISLLSKDKMKQKDAASTLNASWSLFKKLNPSNNTQHRTNNILNPYSNSQETNDSRNGYNARTS